MKILIVDDSKMLLHLMKMLLEKLGYENFTGANSVEEAKKFLLTEKFDLVLSDMHMPGESGIDLLKFIKGVPSLSGLSFIMVTSDTDTGLLTDAVKSGIFAFIVKPVEIETLYAKLAALADAKNLQPPKIPDQPEHFNESSSSFSKNLDINDFELFQVIEKWPSLPDNIRKGILKLISSVS